MVNVRKLLRLPPSETRNSKRYTRSTGGNIAITTVVLLMAAVLALPLVYAVVSAFKPMEEIFIFPPRFFVQNPTLDNFKDLGKYISDLWVPFPRYLFNSLFITTVTTAGNILICSACAYPLALHKFPGRKVMFDIVVVALMFVGQVTFLPRYLVMAKLGMIDTWWALILPDMATSLGVFLMKQFMEQLPLSIIEAARIDGYNEFKIYWHIVMPNVRPAWLTLIIFSFQGIWNDTSVSSMVFTESLRTLPSALSQVAGGGIARVGAASAASFILMLPPIVMFIFAQNRVVETMAFAAIKE